MKISEIKSDEVRNEAVRLALKAPFNYANDQSSALEERIYDAFEWAKTPQSPKFWYNLISGTTPNTPDLKLPEKNPSE